MIDTCGNMILKKETTNVAILLGLSIAVPSTAGTKAVLYEDSDLIECNYRFNNPENVNTKRLDEYFNENYKVIEMNEDIIIKGDIQFLGAIQRFSESQLDLDSDFAKVLDSLTLKMSNNKPLRKRF